MPKHRKLRLRKKLHLDEFVELGFEVKFVCSGTPEPEFLAELSTEVLEPREMAFLYEETGHVFISSLEGSLDEDDIDAVNTWLQSQDNISSFDVGSLVDAWHPPRGARCFGMPSSRRKVLISITPSNG